MGREMRRRPERLAEKLLQIRHMLGLSQNGIIDYLGFKGQIDRETISNYERNKREPDSFLVLAYARAAGIWADVLIDDDLHLPGKISFIPSYRNVDEVLTPIANVLLRLDIDSNEKSSRAEKNLRWNIEKLYLKKYLIEKIGDNQYELDIPYVDDDDLNRQVVIDIMQNISTEAHKHDCSIKWDFMDNETSKHW